MLLTILVFRVVFRKPWLAYAALYAIFSIFPLVAEESKLLALLAIATTVPMVSDPPGPSCVPRRGRLFILGSAHHRSRVVVLPNRGPDAAAVCGGEHTVFLKTIIPSRKATKQYLDGRVRP